MKNQYFLLHLLCSVIFLFSLCQEKPKDSTPIVSIELSAIDSSPIKIELIGVFDSGLLKFHQNDVEKLKHKEDLYKNFVYDLDSLKYTLPTIDLNGVKFYLSEGDLFMTEKDLVDYLEFKQIIDPKLKNIHVPTLIIYWKDGKDVKLSNPTDIKYGIVEGSFTPMEYLQVKEAMKSATSNWEAVCNVDFKYVEESDKTLKVYHTPKDYSFIIQKGQPNLGDNWYAKSPFPNHPNNIRQVLISEYFFNADYSREGIMRHELGHILGFLHEHTRKGAPKDCPDGVQYRFRPLSALDRLSVMHYFCVESGHGTKTLEISKIDSAAASCVYFHPANEPLCKERKLVW